MIKLGIKIFFLTFLTISAKLANAQKFFEVADQSQAQVKFYIADDPDAADLHFCIIYDEKEITKPGVMMEVETPQQAQVLLIFVDDPTQADIKVWLVETPAEVLWKNPEKKKLLEFDNLKKPDK
ncbi:MAG: hypothetical protein H6537_10630 [Bacteroidales bacterium]|mgnify:CR=1 FL=1|nr:hypothetical protein [Bacteroidales bacterium]HPD94774.1 DUF6150 family protein [Tenuifilaceae bacterium]HRX31626.1 DUF6150 family protein [Tenuifilaceae bacterium]